MKITKPRQRADLKLRVHELLETQGSLTEMDAFLFTESTNKCKSRLDNNRWRNKRLIGANAISYSPFF